jgi:hypothetical protein
MSGVGIDRELAHLRARAYGPRADIAGDPFALARLIDLEAAAAPGPAPTAEAESEPEPESPAVEAASMPAVAVEPSRARRLVGAFGVIVASVGLAVVGAALGVGDGGRVNGAHDATLARVEHPRVRFAAERAAFADIVTYADYRGLRVASGTLDGIICIFVLRSVEPGASHPTVACGAPGLAATADVPLPTGTVARFTLGPGVMHVDVSEASVFGAGRDGYAISASTRAASSRGENGFVMKSLTPAE